MSDPRQAAWDAEDRDEGLDVPGTRGDIGVSSADREPDFGPQGAGVTGGDDLPATSSDASTDTSVDGPAED